jgi:hypothetical protein
VEQTTVWLGESTLVRKSGSLGIRAGLVRGRLLQEGSAMGNVRHRRLVGGQAESFAEGLETSLGVQGLDLSLKLRVGELVP